MKFCSCTALSESIVEAFPEGIEARKESSQRLSVRLSLTQARWSQTVNGHVFAPHRAERLHCPPRLLLIRAIFLFYPCTFALFFGPFCFTRAFVLPVPVYVKKSDKAGIRKAAGIEGGPMPAALRYSPGRDRQRRAGPERRLRQAGLLIQDLQW